MAKRIVIGSLAFVLCILMLGYSYFIEPNRLVVNEKEIVIPSLDPAFVGLRIAAISDIHGGSNGASRENIERMVSTVIEQNVDLVVLLGDYVSNHGDPVNAPMQIEEVAELLKPLHARYGVFAVLGNHDGFYGKDRVAGALKANGLSVLQNEIAGIEHNGKTLRLLGLNDHMQFIEWRLYDEQIRRVMANDGRSGDIIVLQHSPDVISLLNHFDVPGDDFRLMIAGHSHGGQVWLPVIGTPLVPSTFGQRYVSGLVKEKGKNMFITTGIGTSQLPFRFMVPPEIAVITLKSE